MIRSPKTLLLLLVMVTGPLARSGWAEATSSPPARKAVYTGGLRPQDSLWMISTRHLGCPGKQIPDVADLRILQYQGRVWQNSDYLSFQNDPHDRTVVFVHGNRVEVVEVYQRGLTAYRALTRGMDDPASIRFVVWSWPSDRICGPRRDVTVKAARTNTDSYYLANVLAGLPPDTDLGLFGFSFGARIISGALHLLGGGQLCGWHVASGETSLALNPRIVLMAAAMERNWWLPGGLHDRCPDVASSILVQYNSCDSVLRWYPRTDWRRRPQALGYTGFPWRDDLGANAHKLQQQNVCCQVGRDHDAERYFNSTQVIARAREVLLAQPAP